MGSYYSTPAANASSKEAQLYSSILESDIEKFEKLLYDADLQCYLYRDLVNLEKETPIQYLCELGLTSTRLEMLRMMLTHQFSCDFLESEECYPRLQWLIDSSNPLAVDYVKVLLGSIGYVKDGTYSTTNSEMVEVFEKAGLANKIFFLYENC